MLFRWVEVDLDRYPALSWNWFIEQPIASEIDELTVAGDDHPARLYLSELYKQQNRPADARRARQRMEQVLEGQR